MAKPSKLPFWVRRDMVKRGAQFAEARLQAVRHPRISDNELQSAISAMSANEGPALDYVSSLIGLRPPLVRDIALLDDAVASELSKRLGAHKRRGEVARQLDPAAFQEDIDLGWDFFIWELAPRPD